MAKQIHLDDPGAQVLDINGLKRPVGVLEILQVRHIQTDDQEKFYFDVGFGIWIQALQHALDDFADQDLILARRTGFQIDVQSYSGSRDDMWLLRAELKRVIDGDTIVVYIDFDLWIQVTQILKLNQINTPALYHP